MELGGGDGWSSNCCVKLAGGECHGTCDAGGENVTGVSLFLEGCLWAGIFGNVWEDVKCQCTEGFVTRRLLCCLDGGVEYDFWVA